jgi:hypothetical protein
MLERAPDCSYRRFHSWIIETHASSQSENQQTWIRCFLTNHRTEDPGLLIEALLQDIVANLTTRLAPLGQSPVQTEKFGKPHSSVECYPAK